MKSIRITISVLLAVCAIICPMFVKTPAAHAYAEYAPPIAYTDGPIDGLEAEKRLDLGAAGYDGTIDNNACIVLIDAETGAVLFEKNPRLRAYPASTTKVLSTLIAIESGRLDELITVGEEVDLGGSWSTMTPALSVGETISLRDMVYGAMLPSGCEASAAIGVALGGSTEAFAAWMNRRALALGMTGSHFVNANGMSDTNHFSTAMDLIMLCRAAMRNETFREVASTYRYVTSPTNMCGERTLTNTNYLISPGHSYYYPYASGIKTGTTNQARFCLTAYAEKDGRKLMLVILRAPSDAARYGYARDLFNWGFESGFTSEADAFFENCAEVNEPMTLAASAQYYYSPAQNEEYSLGSASQGKEFLIKYSAENDDGVLWYYTSEGYFFPASAFVPSQADISWGFCEDGEHPLPSGICAQNADMYLRGTVYCARFIESAEAALYDAGGAAVSSADITLYSTYVDLVTLEQRLFAQSLPAGEYTLVITCASGQSVNTLESSFTVFVPGDVDGDGLFTFTDISALSLYLIGDAPLADGVFADFNGDGEVNFKDIADMYLAKIG